MHEKVAARASRLDVGLPLALCRDLILLYQSRVFMWLVSESVCLSVCDCACEYLCVCVLSTLDAFHVCSV